ncbi:MULTISPECIES: TonB-dependent receptor domain-containing protein [Dyella]|uniref:TonB-dependent receptor n=2 Tax=Dyella TaxID=231454 RepID=A0A4R0YY01_9GAMM|nr:MULTISPECIES: TonB-dependent receptor [Dyella]TBR40157.1 TonB-dependent receptor [Dyella terrae]TCI12259.1 TonB-dependent receptor [Dyella soli]
MKQKTLLATAIAAAFALNAWSVAAQEAPAPAADQANAKSLDTVTVTGSRIRSVDVETSQPIFTMDRQAIQATGLTNVNDILARMPSAGTPDITPQDTLSSGADVGGRYVNIRNLGSQRTLVLVNGRRWATSLSGLTDLSTIPVSMIDRIDVLKDGASSIYGSDAIGGVVNIITRDRFDGTEVNAYYGQNGKGDGQQKNIDVTWGHNTEKSSLILGASYQDQQPVWNNKRDETRYQYGPRHIDDGLGGGPWGRVTDPRAEGTAGAGSYNKDGDWVPNAYVLNRGGNPANIGDYHDFVGAPSDLYNTQGDMTFRAGTKLKNLFAQERYKLTDNITLRGTASYSVRDTSSTLSGYPLQTASTGLVIDPNNAYNPFPGYETEFYRRTVEMPRTTWSKTKLAHIDVGAEGFFDFLGHEWNWDATYNYSKAKVKQTSNGNFYLPNAQNALGPTSIVDGQVVCADASARAAGCVPWNILAGPGGTPSSVWNYVNYIGTSRQTTQTDDFSANLTGGLFDLPGGTVSIAGGIEHRREKGSFNPDAMDSAGLTTNLASNPTNGSYIVNEAYLELDVPLLRDLPGAQELGINVASRYSHYSNFGSTTNNKYSFRWRPFEDLMVRGTYAEGFRAPTISDLYGGSGQSFETYLDPCDSVVGSAAGNADVAARCAVAGVPANYRQIDSGSNQPVTSQGGQSKTAFISGSNPNLQPETSITRTVGLVYSPHQVSGLDFTVDYYNIYVKNIITAVNASSILNYCYVSNDPSFCDRFTRNSSGVVDSLNESLTNLGSLKTEGYDVGIHYRLPETSFGRFRIASDSTYLTKYETVSGPGMPRVNAVGFMTNGSGNLNAGTMGLYRLRSNLQLDWDWKQFGASWTVRYYSGLKDQCWDVDIECNMPDYVAPGLVGVGVSRKGSVAFNDAQFRYTAPWKGTFSVGVNNIFNKKGPYYYNVTASGSGSPPYNPSFDIDRYFYVSYNQKF